MGKWEEAKKDEKRRNSYNLWAPWTQPLGSPLPQAL